MVAWVAHGMLYLCYENHLPRIFISYLHVFSSSFTRWWRLREAQAGLLLTNTFRMQINRRKFNRARCGAVRLQAQYRGRTTRKNNAASKIQSYRRMHVNKRAYKTLRSATISLQCRARRGAAKKEFDQIKREAKDMGKIKEHNEKLKMEMASLKAMLQAQAASDADKVKSKKAIAEKQEEIDRLEARIAHLEVDLEKEKENVKRLENDLNVQKGDNARLSQDLQYQKEMAMALRGASTPTKHARNLSGNELQKAPSGKHSRNFSANELVSTVPAEAVVDAVVVGHTITPEALAQHRAEVARLEEELEEERRMGRAARIQIKNLRAAIADKGSMDVTASTEIISDSLSEMSGSEIDKSDVPNPSELEPQLR